MDNHIRNLLGLTDKHSFFDEKWMTRLPIANTANWFSLSATIHIRHAQNTPHIGLSFIQICLHQHNLTKSHYSKISLYQHHLTQSLYF